MKKVFTIVATFFFMTSFSQEDNTETNNNNKEFKSIGLNISTGQIPNIGFIYEDYMISKLTSKYIAIGVSGNYTATTIKGGGLEFTGNGYNAKLYTKSYWSKDKAKGFYTGHALVYGNIKFDDNDTTFLGTKVNYNGKYRYFSFFSPEIGYDFLIAKKFRINLNAGTQWQIEVKGKGDVDNKSFDNWVHRIGLKLSYDF